jgi:hypothetical protein
MSRRTISEALVMNFFAIHGVGCKPIRRGLKPTADFTIEFARPVVCEVKQIEANDDDVECSGKQDDGGRFLENRIRPLLKSRQLRAASETGTPTLLVIYDATELQAYGDDEDVVLAMFGHSGGSDPAFAADRNASISAVGMLRGANEVRTLSLTLFYNPYARVHLNPRLFNGLPIVHKN